MAYVTPPTRGFPPAVTVQRIAPPASAERAIVRGEHTHMIRTVVGLFLLAGVAAACSLGVPPGASTAPVRDPSFAPVETVVPMPSASAEGSEPTPLATPSWDGHAAEGLAIVRLLDEQDPTTQVFIVEADGSLRQVTGLSNALGASYPVWSPDGSQLAFNDAKGGSGPFGQVGIVNADGTDERSYGEGRDHQWSPDGSQIVYQESDPVGEGETSMYLLDVASGQVTDIGLGALPRWLPDGERISFLRTVELDGGALTSALYVMPAAGGEAELIAEETIAYWSPDGSSVLLEHDGVITLADADFGNPREIANGFSPVWAPDSQSFVVAYDHDADANTILAHLDLDGQARWSGVSGVAPSWSPDGSRLAVEIYAPEFPMARVIEAATGGVVWEERGMQPAWRP